MNTKDKARNKTDGTDGHVRKMTTTKSTPKPKTDTTDMESKYNILRMTDRLHQRV